MLIKDNRTPRGRLEASPARELNLPSFLTGAGGVAWLDANETDQARAFLFGSKPERPWNPSKDGVIPDVIVPCGVCETGFLVKASHASLARFCGNTCRKRAQRARSTAA